MECFLPKRQILRVAAMETAKTDWDPSEGVPEKLYVKEENLLLLDIDTDNRR